MVGTLATSSLSTSICCAMPRPKSPHMVCTKEGCNEPHRSRGLCSKHYAKALRYGALPRRERTTYCTKPGCDKPHVAKGLCQKHYRQALARRNNSPAPDDPDHCPKCGKLADKQHRRYCRAQPKIVPGDGDPRHGTELGYVHHKCRCIPCCRASYEAGLARRRRRGDKELKFVGAHQTHKHLRYLLTWVSMDIVAKTIGRTNQGLYYSLHQTRVPEELAEKVLSTTVSDVLAQVEPTSQLRKEPYLAMVTELLAAGWLKYSICREIGYTPPLHILRPESQFIQARFARRIEYLHNEAWRNNTNGFRRHCKCIQVAEPETTRNTDHQRVLRERKSA